MQFFSKKRVEVRKKKVLSPRLILIRQIVVGVLLVLFFTGVGFGIWHGSRIESLTINEVEIIGGDTIAHETVQKKVEERLVGEYFRMVPKKFAWFYPHDDIVSLVNSIERVKQSHVERVGQKVVVVFEEYKPTALWCKKLTSKDCLFLDRNGYAFATAPWLEGTAFMRYSDTGREPTVGLQAFPAEFIAETNTFVENAYYQIGLNIIHVEQTSEDEIDYHVSGGGLIKVSSEIDTKETLENLETILSSKEFEHLEPGNFKYIDLRYGNKIFVNEEVNEPEKENTASSSEARAVE